jgi:hypothetical protein
MDKRVLTVPALRRALDAGLVEAAAISLPEFPRPTLAP